MKGGQPTVCNCLICIRIRERKPVSQPRSSYKRQQVRKSKQSSQSDPLPRMRVRLFRADPHCFWCGVEVQLERMVVQRKDNLSTLATVDHLYSRWHPERKERHTSQESGVLHVLACHDCNQERAAAETQMIPFIPKLKEKLEFAQRADATLAQRRSKRVVSPVVSPAKTELPSGMVLTLKEEYEWQVCKRPPMRVIQILEEAIKFARENPAR